MNIPQRIKKVYSISIEKIKNLRSTKEKRSILTELIGNIFESGISVSVRLLAKIIGVSRRLISSIIKNIKNQDLTRDKTNKLETRGRKKTEKKFPNIVQHIKEICEKFEFVDKSLRDHIVYINITAKAIIEKLCNDFNYIEVPCENVILRILKEDLKYKFSKVKKNKVAKKIKETEQIFENVNKKLNEVKNANDEILAISIDDKATKNIGNFSDNGKSWKDKEALDHDTNPECKVKPFGILDIKTNQVNVYCTTSNSTSDYKADMIEKYIDEKKSVNPNIEKLYIFLDNGPDNSSTRTLWIYRIILMAIKYQIIIELVYYPPYHSKYNKIEHYWGVLQRYWSGLIIDDLEKLIGAINATKWHQINSKGFLNTDEYEKGKTIAEETLSKLKQMHVHYENKEIEKWSLEVIP